jgi:pimeloyl-ACP methyl ester carboxylesterase
VALQPLILIPGLLCTKDLFAPQIAALGASAKIAVADHTKSNSVVGIARDILAMAPARFALAGLSMGVGIALEMVRQAPARVARLALLDGRAALDDEETKASRRSYIEMARSGRFMEITRDHILARLIHPKRRGDLALVETILGMAEATGPEIFIRQETALLECEDYRPFLLEIRCPTLVVVGTDDSITPPPMAEEMARGIAGARLEIVADCGHLSTLERPVETSALLESWLRA